MELRCTKKLLDFLGLKPKMANFDTDPFFSWTANLISINRRKTLVAVNHATRLLFVLHGLTEKSIPKMQDLILDGISGVLQSEYIAPEIIEKYLDDCGRNITFVSNSSRSATGYCNNACDRVNRLTRLFLAKDMFQQPLLLWVNDFFIPTEEHTTAYEKMIKLLKEKYGENVQSCHAAILEVGLDLLTPCKRTIIVPSNLNFYQLHNILQKAFEWHDYHLHQFIIKKDNYGCPSEIIQPAYAVNEDYLAFGNVKSIDSLSITVKDIFDNHERIEYQYDFGDNWIHIVKLKKFIENCSNPYPHCIAATGDAPMEDSGGAYGFNEKLKILNDTKHPDHEFITDWVRSAWWHPLDIELINSRLEHSYRLHVPVYNE